MAKKKTKINVPLLPLRDVIVFPKMVLPLFVGRGSSIAALEEAMDNDKQVFLVGQVSPETESPKQKDLFKVGTLATVLQLLRLSDGTCKVLVEGTTRASLESFDEKSDFYSAKIKIIDAATVKVDTKLKAMVRSVMTKFEQLVAVNKNIPRELLTSFSNIDDPGKLADSIAAHLTIKLDQRQKVLETEDVFERLQLVEDLLVDEFEMLEVEKRLQGRVRKNVEETQKKYYLTEKIKAIQQELGDIDETGALVGELEQFEERIGKVGMPEEAKKKALAELNKLKLMPPMSAEATVCRNYIDTMLEVPWKKTRKISKDLVKAEAVLEEDHYGLKKVKERILEYLAVQQRVKKLKGPIICLVGPPGVGKTSLGQSIANATGREFIRMSLGGVRDEAEIRGHRRTYIGAMPGKIIQKLSKSKVRNPLFMLDEVDKMAADFRGDPAAALLEVLDPEQNHAFCDHYLEVDYDLTDVMFIATANSLDIPAPLLDRMEVIRLAGYTEDEKYHIAERYLIPRQIKQNGLVDEELNVTEGAVREIIRSYTREAGVRNLDRDVSKICRKVVRGIVTTENKVTKTKSKSKAKSKSKVKKVKKAVKAVTVTKRNIEKYLGVKKFRFGLAEETDQVGQVTGLAWTEVGGELLTIEAQVVAGKGKSIFTGRLGDVMQESISAAMTVVRSRAAMLGVEDRFFQEHDFHVHVPEGATPKDGPSAGIGMCIALVSAITQIPVRADIAMTGEITLRGEVLPIGGLKEKLLAALRGGTKSVMIPDDNERDLEEIPANVKQGLSIHPVKWIDQVLSLALVSQPVAIVVSKASAKGRGTHVKRSNKSRGRNL